jgi:hypothetical protein
MKTTYWLYVLDYIDILCATHLHTTMLFVTDSDVVLKADSLQEDPAFVQHTWKG